MNNLQALTTISDCDESDLRYFCTEIIKPGQVEPVASVDMHAGVLGDMGPHALDRFIDDCDAETQTAYETAEALRLAVEQGYLFSVDVTAVGVVCDVTVDSETSKGLAVVALAVCCQAVQDYFVQPTVFVGLHQGEHFGTDPQVSRKGVMAGAGFSRLGQSETYVLMGITEHLVAVVGDAPVEIAKPQER